MSGTQQMVAILAGELLAFFAVVLIFADRRPKQ